MKKNISFTFDCCALKIIFFKVMSVKSKVLVMKVFWLTNSIDVKFLYLAWTTLSCWPAVQRYWSAALSFRFSWAEINVSRLVLYIQYVPDESTMIDPVPSDRMDSVWIYWCAFDCGWLLADNFYHEKTKKFLIQLFWCLVWIPFLNFFNVPNITKSGFEGPW